MARTRTIKPEFWSDEKLSKISLQARLLYIGMWTSCDDAGRTKGHPLWLKSQIFPYDEISPHQFTKWINELIGIDCIRGFKAKGENYYWIRTFSNHQTINKPSQNRNPLLLYHSCRSVVVLPEYYRLKQK